MKDQVPVVCGFGVGGCASFHGWDFAGRRGSCPCVCCELKNKAERAPA